MADSSPSTHSEGGGAAKKNTMGISLLAALPILLIIVVIVVVLLLILLWLSYRSKRKNYPLSGYHTVPTEDVGPVMNLPYPNRPKIKMMDPPVPGTTTLATQLAVGGQPGSRYPFTDTDNSTSSSEGKGKKSRRLSNRRFKSLDVGRHRSSDRSSDGSEDGSSPVTRSSRVTPPPSPPSIRRGSLPLVDEKDKKPAELSLTLIYKENEAMLTILIQRATGLPNRAEGVPVDSYVRIFFIPNLPELPQRRTSKTQVVKRDNNPVFDETVQYDAMTAEELINSNLHLEVLDYRSYGKHLVLGQLDLPLVQVSFVKGEATATLPLNPPRVRENLGTILVSISYSPDSKKLGVIILRAKDLNQGNTRETDVVVKLWVTLGGDRIIGRMKTKKKPQSCSPIFNEALSCNLEPSQIKNAAVNISVLNESRYASKRELGQVIVCTQCSGEEFRHWNDVMATPGKHIAEWHELR